MNRIHEVLLKGRPDSVAIIDHDGTSYTYEALDALVSETTELLGRHGVRAGDRVLVVSENCVTYLVSVLALSRLDAWVTLVNARLTNSEVDRLMQLADARCAIFTPEASKAARNHADRMKAEKIGDLLCGELLVSPVRASEPEPVDASAEQTAVLIYTSGTVGEPKGVMLSHANLLFMCKTSSGIREIDSTDTVLAVLPGTHIYGLTSVFLSTLMRGCKVICLPQFDVKRVLELIKEDVTVLSAVPQAFATIAAELEKSDQGAVKHSLRYINAGGSPLDLSLKNKVESVLGIPLHNGYGLTEASPGIASTRVGLPRSDSSVGQPFPGVEAVIHDPNEDGIGELWARGPNIMKGYFRNPEATRAALTEDGFLRTGDFARQDADGTIHIVGRLKELIIHSGFNVYPPEVEAVLTAHPAITMSAVVGRPRHENEEVLAFVAAHAPVTEDELRAWVRERMTPYKVPAYIIIADELPQAATGKIVKSKLLDHFSKQLEERDLKDA